METTPKVHRHRHRRSNSRRNQERNVNSSRENAASPSGTTAPNNPSSERTRSNRQQRTEGDLQPTRASSSSTTTTTTATTNLPAVATSINVIESADVPAVEEQHNNMTRRQIAATNSSQQISVDSVETPSQSSVQTVVLVNGHVVDVDENYGDEETKKDPLNTPASTSAVHTPTHDGGRSTESGRNPGETLTLREMLQQHRSSPGTSHRRRTQSPHSPRRLDATERHIHRGILGFMDRELKAGSTATTTMTTAIKSPTVAGEAVSPAKSSVFSSATLGTTGGGTAKKMQSLSDPQASPAQRSTRSRSSIDKSPRRKRSKSESRRRRERKLIAAGEMEVRQANETLMRYLKQCSEMNDASLSGELEIDHNFDERRVHRKTKSQRDKRGHLISKLYAAGGLSSILKDLSDDIVPADGEEIYNPFTPVVSPTEDTPAHIDKMFVQTSSGYRPVDHCYYKHSLVIGGTSGRGGSGGVGGGGVGGSGYSGYGDTRCLLEAQCTSREISTSHHLACALQRIWILVANICHGLLAGLAMAHLIFVMTTHSMDWTHTINDINLGNDDDESSSGGSMKEHIGGHHESINVMEDYAAFAEMYANAFYCLAIVCMVSIFDRMDICHLELSNATELISFRWLIISMIYIATIILTICSTSIDCRLYLSFSANVTLTHDEMRSYQVFNVWNSLSMARSFGAIIGWIMIGLTPHEDLLYEHLLNMDKYQLTNN